MRLQAKEKLSEVFWSILTVLSLIYLGLFVPVLKVSFFFSCLPVVLVIFKYGYKSGLFCLAAAGLTLIITVNVPFAATYLLIFGSLSIGLSLLIKQGLAASRIIGLGSVLCVVMVLVWVVSANLVFKVDPVKIFRDGLELNNRQALELYGSGSLSFLGKNISLDREQSEQMKEQLSSTVDFINKGLGALLFIFSVVGVGLSYIVGVKVFPNYGIRLMRLPDFSRWRPGEGMVWGLILGGVLYFIGTYTNMRQINIAGLNIGMFFLAVYFVSGLSVISYFLHGYKVPVFARAFLYVLFVMQYPFSAGVGLADVWFDFRKRMDTVKKKKEDTGTL